MAKYQVIVGNIGTVEDTDNFLTATRTYGYYKRQSKSGYGRVAREPVTFMSNGEIKWEYEPKRKD